MVKGNNFFGYQGLKEARRNFAKTKLLGTGDGFTDYSLPIKTFELINFGMLKL